MTTPRDCAKALIEADDRAAQSEDASRKKGE
jgi:hypothetical protein